MQGENAPQATPELELEPSPSQSGASTATVVDTQPGAKSDLKLEAIPLASLNGDNTASQEEETPALYSPLPPPPRKHRRRVRPALWRVWRIIVTLLGGLGRVFFIALCAIGVGAIACVFLAISFGFAAANGAIAMLIGNAILRTHLHGYTPENKEAAIVGAVGGLLAAFCVGVIFECVPKTSISSNDEPEHHWVIKLIASVLSGTLTGTIGCAVMRKHMDLTLDIVHATRAGALGGTILSVGVILLFPIILIVIGLILSPLWLAMVMGFQFIHAKSSENWGPNSHSYSYCMCYGTCGDEEIEEEVQKVRDIEARHQQFSKQNRLLDSGF